MLRKLLAQDYVRRALRTVAQFIVAGGLTGLIDTTVGLTAAEVAFAQAGNMLLVTAAQNWLEDTGRIRALGK